MDDGPVRLGRDFFDKSGEELGQALIGQILVRLCDGKRLAGRIVETEAYLGSEDKAAHSYNGQTPRNAAMFMQPGTAYVYNIYGTYCCMNISSKGKGCAVLLRALQPLEGKDDMAVFRWTNPSLTFKVKDLCSGPSKLCQSLFITKANFDQHDLVTDDTLWLEKGGIVPDSMIVHSSRVNIDNAEEWKTKPLRYYLLGSDFVSVKDKAAERQMSGADESDDTPLAILRYGLDKKKDVSEKTEKSKSVSEVKKVPTRAETSVKKSVETKKAPESANKRKQSSEETPVSRKVTRSETNVPTPSKAASEKSVAKSSSTLISKNENTITTPRRGRGRPRKDAAAMKENKAVDNSEASQSTVETVQSDDNHEDAEMDEEVEFVEKAPEEVKKKPATPQPTRVRRTIRFVDVPKGTPLPQVFFMCSSVDLAKGLLGQRLVRIQDGRRISGKIVETEAYLGVKDKGSVAFEGSAEKNPGMFNPPGSICISSVYGHYFSFSICSEDDGGVVLLRSLEAEEGRDLMMKNRYRKSIRDTEICNGPSRLCQALKIDKSTFGNQNIASCENLFIEREDSVPMNNIVCTKRIITEIDAEDWADTALRFYVFGSDCISARDLVAEGPLKSSQYDLDQ